MNPVVSPISLGAKETRLSEAMVPERQADAQSWWKTGWTLTRSAVSAWIDDYAPSMGAALSYYTVFSLAPLLFIVISVAGLVFGQEAARGEIFGQLQGFMGAEAASGIEQMLAGFDRPSQGIAGTLVGALMLVIGATTVFGELQNALDRIWRAPVAAGGSGIWYLLRTRLLSFGMVLGIAFLLMVSLLFSAALSALGKWYGGFFAHWEILGHLVDVVVGFGLTTAAFAMIYKLMPRVRVGWADVWVGAIVTSVLFTVGRLLIGLYIGRAGVASGFGAAGGIIVVFVWVYYSAQIFLLGAEFTWVYAQSFGSRRHLPAAHGTAAAGVAKANVPGTANT
jgi:membrane protein